MKQLIVCMMLISSAVQLYCAGTSIGGEKNVTSAPDTMTGRLMMKIDDINSSSPSGIIAGFVVDGRLSKNKKFKSLGQLVYDGRLKKMKISFIDSVFRSPMAIVLQEGENIKFHLPVEKKIYLDRVNTVDLKNYLNVNVNYSFLQTLAIGKIPLIDEYSVKQGVLHKDENDKIEHFIILENNMLYETISFSNNIPNRIMLLNKHTKEKMEFYLEKPELNDNVLYYKTIRFVSLKSGERITVVFNSLSLNPKNNASKNFVLPVPSGTEIIRVN